jgi:hypothetical protein
MFRKLIALSLIGAGVAAALKKRGQSSAGSSEAAAPKTAAPEAAAPAAAAPSPEPSDLADVRPGQTEATIEAPIAGAGGDEQAVIPDVSDEDALVRQQENAAAADAGSIGGTADTVAADVDPEMRPVYEGSGGDTETFETTDEQGR